MDTIDCRPDSDMENKGLVDIGHDVKRFILDNFMYGYDESQLSDDTSFLKAGVLDSTGIMEMIELVEREFGIEVRDSEILPENFDSISSISRYIRKKQMKRRAV